MQTVNQAAGTFTGETKAIKLTKEQVETIFDRVMHVAAKSVDGQYQSILEGVHIKATNGRLDVCATDGSRLVHFLDDLSIGGHDLEALIPAKSFQELRKQWRKKTAGECVLGVFADTKTFTIGTVNGAHCVEGKQIEGQYPRYQELFPDKFSVAGYLVDTDKLTEHCERVSKLGKALDFPPTIKLHFSASEAEVKLSMLASYNDIRKEDHTRGAHYSATIKGSSNEAFEICFSADYLADVIKNTDGMLDFGTNLDGKRKATKPVVFTDRNNKVKHLLMPIETK